MDLLNCLIVVSEKAANVARIIRKDEHLFKMLVQKKSSEDANPRFVEDFKTLADVLIQEMVKHDLSEKFPSIKDRIRGEENNIFSNQLGETVCVEVKNSIEETSALLGTVLNGDNKAAMKLANEVHKNVHLNEVNTVLPKEPFDLNIDNCEVWIDPIDSTAEYISGIEKKSDVGIHISGLQCVTVLIGVYDNVTRLPVLGVINQPFVEYVNDRWRGSCVWGISTKANNIPMQNASSERNRIICLSSSEDCAIKNKLSEHGFKLIEAAGAGYKMLTVVKGLADAYVLSKDSTFKWDTCGPQAILKSLGGDVVNYNEATAKNNIISVKYTNKEGEIGGDNCPNCNSGGILAVRDLNICTEIVNCLNVNCTEKLNQI